MCRSDGPVCVFGSHFIIKKMRHLSLNSIMLYMCLFYLDYSTLQWITVGFSGLQWVTEGYSRLQWIVVDHGIVVLAIHVKRQTYHWHSNLSKIPPESIHFLLVLGYSMGYLDLQLEYGLPGIDEFHCLARIEKVCIVVNEGIKWQFCNSKLHRAWQ